MNNDERKALQSDALCIYQHDHESLIQGQMNLRYSERLMSKYVNFIKPTRNPLRRVADLQAVMYQRSPRVLSPDNEDIILDVLDHTKKLYPALEEAQKMVYALGDVFLWPYWDDQTQKIYIDIIPPHRVDVKLNRGVLRSVQIDMSDGGSRLFHCGLEHNGVTGTYWLDLDKKGKPKTAMKPMNLGYENNVFPLIWMSLNPVSSTCVWSIGDIKDLINGTLEVNELEALHDFPQILNSYKQAFDKSRFQDPNAEEVEDSNPYKFGPGNVIPFEVGTIDLGNPTDPFLTTIQKIESDLASTRGISSITYHRAVTDDKQSGSITEELRQRWRKQVKIFMDYELELYRVLISIINQKMNKNYDIDTQINIDYFSPEELNDTKKTLEELKLQIELGVNRREDFIFKNSPNMRHMSEADDYRDLCDKSRALWSERMASRNISKDPTDPTQDPTVNGAQGKGASGPLNPNSLEFKQDENDARSDSGNTQGDNE